MSIIRISHKKKYFCMSNAAAQDERLSARALGLLCRLLSLPEDWTIRSTTLHKHFPEGREAIAKAFKELNEHGYIEKKMYVENNLKRTEFIVHEEPFSNNVSGERVSSKPALRAPKTRPLLSTNIPSTEKQSTQQEQGEGPKKSLEEELYSSLAAADFSHAIEFMKSTEEWKDKENPLGYLIKAGRDRWTIRKDRGKNNFQKHHEEAIEFVKKYEQVLGANVFMKAEDTCLLITSGMTDFKYSYRSDQETWKNYLDFQINRMNLSRPRANAVV